MPRPERNGRKVPTYDLRSGSPDFVDRMVAITFAGWRWTR